jgi:predicted nucleic acid-binding protein
MARVIIADSDVLIDALRGVEPVRTRVAEAIAGGALATSAITVFELCTGARSPSEQASVDALLGPLSVLPLDGEVARVAAAVERGLLERGLRVGFADALIAATCLAAGAPLLTRNTRHFARIPGLCLEPMRP